MIPVRKEHNLQQHGSSVASNKMTIKATPEMFDLLSSGIYKNPIDAVVREYLANAVDESDVVDVVIPTSLSPYFKVRDYGEGMEQSFVLELFSSYGFSDKNTNNNQIGGFGIGSKAGFAYTDSFTVRSWHDGSVSTYECTKAHDGSFNITLRGSRSTTEASGVEICIPIKYADFSIYRKKIHHYVSFLKFFRGIKFNGINDNELYIFKHIKGNLYSNTSSESQLTVVMGGIPYQCNMQGIISNSHIQLLEDSYFSVVQPIGSLSITASRESIRYNDDTIAKLKPVFEDATKDLVKHHQDMLDSLTTPYSKYKYAVDLPSTVRVVLSASKYNITLNEVNKVQVNKAGTVKDNSYTRYNIKYLFDDLSRYYMQRINYDNILLIDTDKFVPSRIKAAWNEVGQVSHYLKPVNSVVSAEKELKDLGIPYTLLSSYEPKRLKRTTTKTSTGPVITKDEALVVYYQRNREYPYSHEQTLDLANPGQVCYYDRNTEKEYELDINKYNITEGYTVISATNKNLTKLKASKVPHISTIRDQWIAGGKCNDEVYLNSYLNHHWNGMPDEIGYIMDTHYNKTLSPSYLWADLPQYIKDNIDTTLANQLKKELEDKVKYIKGLTVKDYTGTKDVPVYDVISWYKFRDKVGL